MARRTSAFRKVQALDDPLKLGQLTALEKVKLDSYPDATEAIPGTAPEKMVYNFLLRLHVKFAYQYVIAGLDSTSFPEELYRPDFFLPDYNTYIETFGEYWHSVPTQRASDLKKWARMIFSGLTVIEHGIPTFPDGGGSVGKYIIWWEPEIYMDLPFLFTRDLPELFQPGAIKGEAEPYVLDAEKEFQKSRSRKYAMITSRMRPKMDPYLRQLKRLRRQTHDLSKVSPMYRQIIEDYTPKRIRKL
jgi:hypothetical protein